MDPARQDGSLGDQFSAQYVGSEYFLRLIHEFEEKYDMGWGEFLANYTTGRYAENICKNPDFAEWAFLCNNFMSELIGQDYGGPPGDRTNPCFDKPEADSGFFFGGMIVRRRCVLRECRTGPFHMSSHLLGSVGFPQGKEARPGLELCSLENATNIPHRPRNGDIGDVQSDGRRTD